MSEQLAISNWQLAFGLFLLIPDAVRDPYRKAYETGNAGIYPILILALATLWGLQKNGTELICFG